MVVIEKERKKVPLQNEYMGRKWQTLAQHTLKIFDGCSRLKLASSEMNAGFRGGVEMKARFQNISLQSRSTNYLHLHRSKNALFSILDTTYQASNRTRYILYFNL